MRACLRCRPYSDASPPLFSLLQPRTSRRDLPLQWDEADGCSRNGRLARTETLQPSAWGRFRWALAREGSRRSGEKRRGELVASAMRVWSELTAALRLCRLCRSPAPLSRFTSQSQGPVRSSLPLSSSSSSNNTPLTSFTSQQQHAPHLRKGKAEGGRTNTR